MINCKKKLEKKNTTKEISHFMDILLGVHFNFFFDVMPLGQVLDPISLSCHSCNQKVLLKSQHQPWSMNNSLTWTPPCIHNCKSSIYKPWSFHWEQFIDQHLWSYWSRIWRMNIVFQYYFSWNLTWELN